MKRSRWVFGVVFLLALASVFSVRHSVVAWLLSARFSTRIESKSLTTSLDSSAIELQDTSIDLIDGRSVRIGKAHAQIDIGTLWQGDLVVDQLVLEGVSIPASIPNSTPLALPTLPEELSTTIDVQSWSEPWIQELVSGIDRDADRVLVATRDLTSRASQLQFDLERTLTSNPSELHDRKHAAQMAREYHAIKQKLAELRIQARSNGKDQSKKWSQISESLSEKFQNRLLTTLPDADRQIQLIASTYSQRVTPMVLAYCDIVAAAMNPRGQIKNDNTNDRKTLIRKASLSGVITDKQGANPNVPFECQSCQWAWGSTTKLPTTSVWTFVLPNRRGRLEIQAEQKASQQGRPTDQPVLQMSCYWYNAESLEPFQANPTRIRIDVQQTDYERQVSLSAPWDPRQDASAKSQLGLTALSLSFRQNVQRPERSQQNRTIPVAWESVAVEPRILFEMENALEQTNQRWIRDAQARWGEIVPQLIADKQEQSRELWQRCSEQTMSDLLNIETQLKDWQERWDCSTSLEQFRVGSRLGSHPDAYSLTKR